MKTYKKWMVAGCLGLVSVTSNAQFTLTGEIRPRAEYRNGFKTPMDSSQTNAFFVDQRTRLNFGYKVKDYEFYVSAQDVRVWGSTAQLNVSDGFLSLYEAWAKANFNENWGLKLGRQEITYDDQRIFGGVGWAQQARSHDAALLQFKNEKSKLDVAVAFNQANAGLTGTGYTGPSSYRDMYYAWYNHKISKKIETSWLLLGLGREAEPKVYTYVSTFGTHTKFNFDKFKLNFNGFYQFGSDNNNYTDTDGKTFKKGYSGYLVGLDMKYQASEPFGIGLGYELQSGTSQTDTTDSYNSVNHSFSPWFGTNHKFNGVMDYFYVGSGHGNVGLQDAYLNVTYKKKIWTFDLSAHLFMMGLGAEVFDTDSYTAEFNRLVTAGDLTAAADLDQFDYKYNSMLGTEIDFSIATKINPSVTLKGGFSYMMASEALYNLKGVNYYNLGSDGTMSKRDLPSNTWGYVMIIFKPDFLKKSEE